MKITEEMLQINDPDKDEDELCDKCPKRCGVIWSQGFN